MTYQEIAGRVLSMLKQADGNDPSNGHLTMNNWEWPTGVALYGIYKTYQQTGDPAILDYLTSWYDDNTAGVRHRLLGNTRRGCSRLPRRSLKSVL